MPVAEVALPWQIMALGLLLPLGMDAVRRSGFPEASRHERLTWLVATVVMIVAHRAAIDTPSGYSLHYLGGSALTLIVGYPRAVLSMMIIVAVDALLGQANLPLVIALLAGAVLPVWLTFSLYRLTRRWLPANPFIFFFVCGFFGLFAVYAAQQWLSIGLWRLMAPAGLAGADDLTAYAMLLAWGEALLEGMVLTVMVVYLPGTVRLFDDGFYLFNERPPRQ